MGGSNLNVFVRAPVMTFFEDLFSRHYLRTSFLTSSEDFLSEQQVNPKVTAIFYFVTTAARSTHFEHEKQEAHPRMTTLSV